MLETDPTILIDKKVARGSMLSALQQSEFEQVGLIRLSGVFSATAAQHMCDQIWQLLAEKHGIHADKPATWTIRQPTGFQALTRSRVFNPVASEVLTNALDQLLGEAWERPARWGVPLVTFPDHSSEWQLPHSQRHLDFPARGPAQPLPGVRVLAFIAPVFPCGGGTLVLAGSHRLVERLVAAGGAGQGHSTEVRNALARMHGWLDDLWSGSDHNDRIQLFMVDGNVIEGVTLRVIELTGVPGDVVLMHPWAFHAPSPNCGTRPRFMISHSVFRAAAIA